MVQSTHDASDRYVGMSSKWVRLVPYDMPRLPEETERTIAFCNRWLQKSASYQQPNSVNDAYDRFISIFVAFNRLYWHVAVSTKLRGENGDRQQAKTVFPRVVGFGTLAAALRDPDESDVEKLRALIGPEGKFYVIPRGASFEPDAEANKALVENLEVSRPDDLFVPAAIELLYQLRCNLLHGRKDLNDPAQLDILEPASRLLGKVVAVGLRYLIAESTTT